MSSGQSSLRRHTTLQNISVAVAGSILLAACGGGSSNSGSSTPPPPTMYTVGGTISGLTASGLVLQNNTDTVSPAANATTFTFGTSLASGASYSVSVKTQPTGQTCTVASGSGTIASANITNVAVTCTTPSDTIGGTVTGLGASATGLKLADNGGDTLPISTNGTFVFATSLAPGKPYAVTVAQQPTNTPPQYCTVSAGSGTTGAGNVTTVAVKCRTQGQYLFTTVHSATPYPNGLVTEFNIDPATGIPSRELRHGTASMDPWGISLDTSGKYAYVTFINDSNSQLGSVTFDPVADTITDNDTAHTLGANAVMLTVATDPNPSGNAPYIFEGGTLDYTRSQGEIFAYSVAAGKVTPVGAEVDLDGGYPFSLAVDPTGKFLFAPQPATGAPSPQPPTSGTPDVWVYQINADGSLTPVTGAPFTFQAGGTTNTPFGVAVNPNGGYVYFTDNTADTVTAYSYSAAGALTMVGTPQGVGQDPTGVAVDPTGQFLYVTNANEATVSAFTINQTTGVLTAVGSAVATGASRSLIPNAIQVDPSGGYVYVSNGADATVAAFSINRTTGALTEIGSVSGDPQSAAGLGNGGTGSSALAIE